MINTVLIVEDDKDIADLISVNLHELGVNTEHQCDGECALNQALANDYSLLILDVMLPTVSGLDICRQVRQARPEQAIIMLTSKNSETDRVLGLELGADDYMSKPFSIRELQARVRAQLRRVNLLQQKLEIAKPEDTFISIGQLTINEAQHTAKLSDQILDLTATEFELLKHFAKHPDQVFSRTQLLENVWGYHHNGYEHTVNSHINRLRTKLEQNPAQANIIQTVWGVGYKLNSQGIN